MLSKDRVDTFIRKPLEAGLTRSEQMEMATELLSLRDQLAELKALPPVAEVVSWNHPHEKRKIAFRWLCFDVKPGTLLYAIKAAKPGALPRHIFSMLVNELRDVPAVGCKRELIIGVLNRHGVTAEPVDG